MCVVQWSVKSRSKAICKSVPRAKDEREGEFGNLGRIFGGRDHRRYNTRREGIEATKPRYSHSKKTMSYLDSAERARAKREEERAKTLLRKYAAEHALEASHNFDVDHDVEKRFKEILEGRARRRARDSHPSYGVVPLSKLRLQRAPTAPVAARLREQARLRFRRRKTVRVPGLPSSTRLSPRSARQCLLPLPQHPPSFVLLFFPSCLFPLLTCLTETEAHPSLSAERDSLLLAPATACCAAR